MSKREFFPLHPMSASGFTGLEDEQDFEK